MNDTERAGAFSDTADAVRTELRPYVERFVRVALQGAPADRTNAPIGLLRALQRFEQWPGSVDSFVTTLTDELARYLSENNTAGLPCDETRSYDATFFD